MRQFLLTGIANEVNFRENASVYFLVFNDGELRLPVDEVVAECAVAAMMGEDDEEPVKEAQSWPAQEDLEQEVVMKAEGAPRSGPSNGTHKGVSIEGADYYSAQDDYSAPPDYRDEEPSDEDIEDGVGQF